MPVNVAQLCVNISSKKKDQPSSWTPCFRQNKMPRFRQSGDCWQGCILSFLISTVPQQRNKKTDWNIFPAAGDNGDIIFCHFSSRLALLSCKLLLARGFPLVFFLSLSLSSTILGDTQWVMTHCAGFNQSRRCPFLIILSPECDNIFEMKNNVDKSLQCLFPS